MLLTSWKRRRVLRRAKKVFQSSGGVEDAGALLLACRQETRLEERKLVAGEVGLGRALLEKCLADGDVVEGDGVNWRRASEETREPQGRVAVERQAVGKLRTPTAP